MTTRIGLYAVKERADIFVDLYMATIGGNVVYRAIWRPKKENPRAVIKMPKKFTYDSEQKALGSLGLETHELKRDWAGV